jgi:oxygen-independent coproporphyrinogen-3 oxidase
VAAGASPVEQWERLTPAQVRGERLVLGLRLVEGVPRAWVEDHLAGRADRLLARYLEAGVVAAEGERIALTGRGVLLSDTLLAELV